MDFALPAVLKEELKIYDPALRKAAQLEAQIKRDIDRAPHQRKSSPLGKVSGLFPEAIVRKELQERAVEHINRMPASRRFYCFQRPIQDATYPAVQRRRSAYGYGEEGIDNRVVETYAILYHYESRWIAAWIMPKDDPAIYGVSWTYRDNESTREKLTSFAFGSTSLWSDHFPEDHEAVSRYEQKLGRTTYVSHSVLVTPEMIRDGIDQNLWLAPGLDGYKKKNKEIAMNAVGPFEITLSTRIPTWNDGPNILSRIKQTAESYWLYEATGSYFSCAQSARNAGIDPTTWQLNATNVINVFKLQRYSYECITETEENHRKKVCDLMLTPKLKAWAQGWIDDYINKFNDGTNTSRSDLHNAGSQITRLFNVIQQIQSIWDDVPLDFIHNNLDILLQVKCALSRANETTRAWLKEHMPIKTYFHLLNVFFERAMKEYQEKDDQTRRWHHHNNDSDKPTFSFSDFDDTISMLNVIFSAQQTIDPPKRWRIAEFHEHVQIKAWTIENPNVDLPQDLFPTPIKVTLNRDDNGDGDLVTLFQPLNTHQLGQWGQAVRNCVGRASSYAESVKAKKAFLVLGMLNNIPTFTMQLVMESGQLSVKQIVGYANSSLDSAQKDLISKAFRQALEIRAAQSAGSIDGQD